LSYKAGTPHGAQPPRQPRPTGEDADGHPIAPTKPLETSPTRRCSNRVALADGGWLRHVALGGRGRTPRARWRTADTTGRLPPRIYASGMASGQPSTDSNGAGDPGPPDFGCRYATSSARHGGNPTVTRRFSPGACAWEPHTSPRGQRPYSYSPSARMKAREARGGGQKGRTTADAERGGGGRPPAVTGRGRKARQSGGSEVACQAGKSGSPRGEESPEDQPSRGADEVRRFLFYTYSPTIIGNQTMGHQFNWTFFFEKTLLTMGVVRAFFLTIVKRPL
jgi:hypothetical protein